MNSVLCRHPKSPTCHHVSYMSPPESLSPSYSTSSPAPTHTGIENLSAKIVSALASIPTQKQNLHIQTPLTWTRIVYTTCYLISDHFAEKEMLPEAHARLKEIG